MACVCGVEHLCQAVRSSIRKLEVKIDTRDDSQVMCKFECKCSVRGGEEIRLLTKIVNSQDVAQSAARVAYLGTHAHAANNW